MNSKDFKTQLVTAYDHDAKRRKADANSRSPWKIAARKNVADIAQAKNKTTFTDPTRMNLPRFFSFLDDSTLQQIVSPLFEIIKADTVDVGESESGLQLHFQSLLLRKK